MLPNENEYGYAESSPQIYYIFSISLWSCMKFMFLSLKYKQYKNVFNLRNHIKVLRIIMYFYNTQNFNSWTQFVQRSVLHCNNIGYKKVSTFSMITDGRT